MAARPAAPGPLVRLGGAAMLAAGAYWFLWDYPRSMRVAVQFQIDGGTGVMWPQYLQHELAALLWILAGAGLLLARAASRPAPLDLAAGAAAAAWGLFGLTEGGLLLRAHLHLAHPGWWVLMKAVLPAAWVISGVGVLLSQGWGRGALAIVAAVSLGFNGSYLVRVALEPQPNLWTAMRYQLVFGVKDLVVLWWVAAERGAARSARA